MDDQNFEAPLPPTNQSSPRKLSLKSQEINVKSTSQEQSLKSQEINVRSTSQEGSQKLNNELVSANHESSPIKSIVSSPGQQSLVKIPPLSIPIVKSPGSIVKESVNSSIRSKKSINSTISSKNETIEKKNINSPKNHSIISENAEKNIKEVITNLEPQGKSISDHVDELAHSIKDLSTNNCDSSRHESNIDKIAAMSKVLTSEANALRESIRTLSQDIARTKQDLGIVKEETNCEVEFPYHLFLLEIIVNKIHMKCECFEIDSNNLIISATFLGKHPIILYDSSYGKIDNFDKLNVGKSILFAMTYDKICTIKDFEITLELTKQPPCSHCVTKVGETHMDYSKEFINLREELCTKWCKEQPADNIICTTSTPLLKNQYYLSCGESENSDAIGVIEVTIRMSFLGKEITTAFCAAPKPQGTSLLLNEDNGMKMYSCHKVEMDDHGKILLDEEVLKKKESYNKTNCLQNRSMSPISGISSISKQFSTRPYMEPLYFNQKDDFTDMPKYDEIFTKMNANELKIRVPKSTKIERTGKYDRIQELCTCESTPYNTGDQIQFELPRDFCDPDKAHNTYSSNLKYTVKTLDNKMENKDRKIINVTPTNCPVPINMEKMLHPQKDVFILKIGKKLETKDKKTDLEIEFVTPKSPFEKSSVNNNISQQCSEKELKSKSKSEKKGKGKRKSNTNLAKKKAKEKSKQSSKKQTM